MALKTLSYASLYVARKRWCASNSKVSDGWTRYEVMRNRFYIPTRPIRGNYGPRMAWATVKPKSAPLYFRRKRWKVANTMTKELHK